MAPSGAIHTKCLRADALGGAQEPPGGQPVELLDGRARLVAGAAGQVHDRLDAAQCVAPARGIGQIADRQLHPDPFRPEPPGVTDQTPDGRAARDQAAHHGVTEQSGGAGEEKHAPRLCHHSHMAYVIAEPCIGTKDNSCVEVCPVDCIHPTPDEPDYDKVEMLFIDPDECIDCDACVEACPVDACFAEDQLPDEWANYAEKNAAYYAGR